MNRPFTSQQVRAMQQRFKTYQYLALPELATLASSIGVSKSEVRIWFQEERRKHKRLEKEKNDEESEKEKSELDLNSWEWIDLGMNDIGSPTVGLNFASNGMSLGENQGESNINLFSQHQVHEMEKQFKMTRYLNDQEREQLATSIGLTTSQVKVWFRNERSKLRRLRMEKNGEESEKEKSDLDLNSWEWIAIDMDHVQSPTLNSNGISLGENQEESKITLISQHQVQEMEKQFKMTRYLNIQEREQLYTTIIFTTTQVRAMQESFKTAQYLALPEIATLARSIGVSTSEVKVWFQMERAKLRKLKMKKNGGASEME